MPLSPQHRRRGPHATAVNHALANADQNLTKVDTRLTKIDTRLTEVDARLTKVDTVNPRANPKPQQSTAKPQPARHPVNSASTFAVNPSNTSRTNLNNPEQIRTNPNTAKRPDQIGIPPGSPPITLKKRNSEHRRRLLATSHPSPHLASPHSPIHPSPLLGGRLGGGCELAIVYQRSSRRSRSHPIIPAPSVIPAPSRHSCAPPVIPAQAGTRAQPPAPTQPPTPLSVSPLSVSPLSVSPLSGGRAESSQSHPPPRKFIPPPF